MNSSSSYWQIREGEGPLVAAAIHDGHELRAEVASGFALGEDARLREEDPFTGEWTRVADTRIVARYSRFQVDLNRPRDKAVYLGPEDAWGLEVWRQAPAAELIARSLQEYDAFYEEAHRLLSSVKERHGRFVVYDLHSYNHRRGGPDAPPAEADGNPEVNVGTGTLDRGRWGPVVDRFIGDLLTFDFLGRRLDVRENVKFRGGHFSRWAHETFQNSGCVLAIEFKKFFMDEWTGEKDPRQHDAIQQALQATVAGVLEALERTPLG